MYFGPTYVTFVPLQRLYVQPDRECIIDGLLLIVFIFFCIYKIFWVKSIGPWAYWQQILYFQTQIPNTQTHTHPLTLAYTITIKPCVLLSQPISINERGMMEKRPISFDKYYVCTRNIYGHTQHINYNYETIISFMDDDAPALVVAECGWNWAAFMTDSLKSRRKKDRFCVNRSRFFMSRLRSTDTIRLLNQMAIVSCFSSGCDRMMFSLSELKRTTRKKRQLD